MSCIITTHCKERGGESQGGCSKSYVYQEPCQQVRCKTLQLPRVFGLPCKVSVFICFNVNITFIISFSIIMLYISELIMQV